MEKVELQHLIRACASWEHLDAWPKTVKSIWRTVWTHTDSQSQVCFYMAPRFCFIFYFLLPISLSLIFSKASASKETAAPFVKSESQEMQIGYHQQTCAFGSNTPGLLNIWKYCWEDFDHCRVWKDISNSDSGSRIGEKKEAIRRSQWVHSTQKSDNRLGTEGQSCSGNARNGSGIRVWLAHRGPICNV